MLELLDLLKEYNMSIAITPSGGNQFTLQLSKLGTAHYVRQKLGIEVFENIPHDIFAQVYIKPEIDKLEKLLQKPLNPTQINCLGCGTEFEGSASAWYCITCASKEFQTAQM